MLACVSRTDGASYSAERSFRKSNCWRFQWGHNRPFMKLTCSPTKLYLTCSPEHTSKFVSDKVALYLPNRRYTFSFLDRGSLFKISGSTLVCFFSRLTSVRHISYHKSGQSRLKYSRYNSREDFHRCNDDVRFLHYDETYLVASQIISSR